MIIVGQHAEPQGSSSSLSILSLPTLPAVPTTPGNEGWLPEKLGVSPLVSEGSGAEFKPTNAPSPTSQAAA